MPESHPHALPARHRLEEYEIVRVLGAGGFGITYLAFDHQLDGPVAIKEYFPAEVAMRADGWRVAASSADRREVFAWGLDRFTEEARSIHRFRHRSVVRVHRYVEGNGTAYIVMEYVEGESLQKVLDAEGTLPAAAWRRWMDPLLDGLAHVHGQGYLHRDLKPANIVIRAADGGPVLIDFGAARVAARERTHTQVLTPSYAPIEQYSSNGVQGPPTDIYALAAVSYRALTGQPPPTAPDRVLDDRYEPLIGRAVGGRILGAPRPWLAAIDEAMAVRPEDRPRTVAAWREKLHSAALDTARTVRETAPRRSEPFQREAEEAERRVAELETRIAARDAAETEDTINAKEEQGYPWWFGIACLGAWFTLTADMETRDKAAQMLVAPMAPDWITSEYMPFVLALVVFVILCVVGLSADVLVRGIIRICRFLAP